MKTTLQFNDEEEHEAKCAMHALDIHTSLWRASEDLARLVNDRPGLAFTEAQEAAIREVMIGMGEGLDFLE